MDKNEVITLSSDEESDFTHRYENSNVPNKLGLKHSTETVKSCLEKFKNITVNKNKHVIILNKKPGVQFVSVTKVPEKKQKLISKELPEIVDLESSEKSVEDELDQFPCTNHKSPKIDENHSNLDIIDVDEVPNGNNTPNNNYINKHDVTKNNVSNLNKVQESFPTETNEKKINKGSDQNLQFFTEFVEHCGCLEEIPNDRARLTKKLMKRYGEADSKYIKSEEFKNVIQKCRDKVNKNNLYLIAKEITDELSYRKKIGINTGKSNLVEETCQRDQDVVVTDKVQQITNKQSRKRTKVINKVIKKLDKLGSKIRQLEEREVDLSDEEDSSYLQLQRYRERFCKIYTRLCKYTNEVPDADRVYNRRICFSESKYPEINKCIENWLNKTKRFPDFSDIMKLLESQSSTLGLPSNRESIRTIAIEIFEKVGIMLQRRRKYDLWDSFCGYLDEREDPAINDVLLDKVLKNNYEIRIKKEQDIFKHFADLQEKERLEPEEVPDDEANHSPVDSGNEDDKEIEAIENSLNKKLDNAIKKATEEIGTAIGKSEWEEDKKNSLETPKDGEKDQMISKESKNNYRNCKSLKWRLKNETKGKSDSVSSEDSATAPETEKETQKKPENEINGKTDETESKFETEVGAVKDSKTEDCNKVEMETGGSLDTSLKRKYASENEDSVVKKRKCSDKENEGKGVDVFEAVDESQVTGKKTSEVFEIRHCQIFAENFFKDLNGREKDKEKRKVFRDLTNVGRLMGLHGRNRKMSGLFYPPSFFHQSFSEFEKSSWKKRFKVSFKLVGSKGEKCALNEGKSEKTVNPDSGGDKKNIQNNSEGTGDDDNGDNLYGGRGNGSEGDNNEDENKKNGRTGDELNENQHEEDEDEEENENEKEDNKGDAESVEHSLHIEKTEEPSDRLENSLESVSNQGEREEEEKKVTENEETMEVERNEKATDLETNEEAKDVESNEEVKDVESNEEAKDVESNEEAKDVESNEEVKDVESNEEAKDVESNEEVKDVESNEEAKDVESNEEAKDVESNEEVKGVESNEEAKDVETTEEATDVETNEEVKDVDTNEKATDFETNEETKDVESNEEVKNEGSRNEVTNNEEVVEVEESEKECTNAVGTPREDTDMIAASQSSNHDITNVQCVNKPKQSKKINTSDNSGQKSRGRLKSKATFIAKENERVRAKRKSREIVESKLTIIKKPIQVDIPGPKLTRRNTPSTSDEEIVKRFLLHSPSSISITPPRKLSLSKPPSQAAMQALATLRNLKGISATIVRGSKPKSEDDVVVIGGSYRRREEQDSNFSKRRRTDLPVISNVQSIDATTPKIVTVQGNVSGFENSWPEVSNDGNLQCNSSSIRISNVWGSLPNTFMQSGQEGESPGCSSRQNNPGSSNSVRKKNAKKTVEYVVLE